MSSYKKIIKHLIEKNISIAIAESCSGGQLSKAFTDIPGVSKIFKMGLITYSNESKKVILNIPKTLLKKCGSVSIEVANLMCKNLFKISKCNLCISITGIAGPSGSTKNKPLGLVYISIIFYKKKYLYKKKFHGNRSKIQKDTVNFCFKKIKELI